MKFMNMILVAALLTFTAATVAQAVTSDTPLKFEVKKDQNLKLSCAGMDPRGCGTR